MSGTKDNYQIWLNDAKLIGHVDAGSDDVAMEVAVYHVRDYFEGDVPVGTKWSVCEIQPGYYKEISDMNQRAGFNAQTDF